MVFFMLNGEGGGSRKIRFYIIFICKKRVFFNVFNQTKLNKHSPIQNSVVK